MKAIWLSTHAIELPFDYCLCLTEKQYHRELKKLHVPKADWPAFVPHDDFGAAVHWAQNTKSSHEVGLVTLRASPDASRTEIYAMLAHEAVHIKQKLMKWMGEDEPSKEFEAYVVQRISQNLFCAYEAMRKK